MITLLALVLLIAASPFIFALGLFFVPVALFVYFGSFIAGTPGACAAILVTLFAVLSTIKN